MQAYIYHADMYCAPCAQAIKTRLSVPFVRDSDSYPQGPYARGGGEADTPQHCGACGVFLENPLTTDGRAYVIDRAQEMQRPSDLARRTNWDLLRMWLDFYQITEEELCR